MSPQQTPAPDSSSSSSSSSISSADIAAICIVTIGVPLIAFIIWYFFVRKHPVSMDAVKKDYKKRDAPLTPKTLQILSMKEETLEIQVHY